MKHFLPTLFLLCLPFIARCADPMVIEPEDKPYNGDVQVEPEEGTMGGSYVRTEKAYGPLFSLEVPEGKEPLTIWVRARGQALCLKAVAEDNSQTELKWLFKMPEVWTWRSFGTFDRADLKFRIAIIRNPQGTEDAGLDAVILSSDPSFDPNHSDMPGILK